MTKAGRYDFKKQGQHFVFGVLWLQAALIVAYVILHILIPSRMDCKLVTITAAGRIMPADLPGLDWFVGPDRSKFLLAKTAERYEGITRVRQELMTLLNEVGRRAGNFKPTDISEMMKLMEGGKYSDVREKYNTLIGELSETTRIGVFSPENLRGVPAKLDQLITLREEQEADLKLFEPSCSVAVFWTDPTMSLFEVLFWAMFGVIVNLLVNSAKYLSGNAYRPAERWIYYTKLAYGPILSLIVVMAIMNGWIDPKYEVRVWTLPLVGFLLGYSTRRVAVLIDRLSEAFLGKVEESMREVEGNIRARNDRLNMFYELSHAPNLDALRDLAKRAARDAVVNAVAAKEAKV